MLQYGVLHKINGSCSTKDAFFYFKSPFWKIQCLHAFDNQKNYWIISFANKVIVDAISRIVTFSKCSKLWSNWNSVLWIHKIMQICQTDAQLWMIWYGLSFSAIKARKILLLNVLARKQMHIMPLFIHFQAIKKLEKNWPWEICMVFN